MSEPNTDSELLETYCGQTVVLDAHSPFVYVGKLVEFDHRYLKLKQADVHDLRDTNTTREKYVLEAALYGVQANRVETLVRRDEIVSLSRLDEVVT